MKKNNHTKNFIRKPIYPGGRIAMEKFIHDNLQIPEEAIKNNVEGKVFLKYDVNYKGEVGDITIERSLGFGCDEEAIRVIKLLKYQTFKHAGLKVIFHYKTWVNFKQPVKNEIQVNYYYIEKNKNPHSSLQTSHFKLLTSNSSLLQ